MYTVFGSVGFIGRHIASYLRAQGSQCLLPSKQEEDSICGPNLGHVFYCIGLTADFRTRQWETVEAHVCKLARLLPRIRYDSFTYLSSTRVYARSACASEETQITVCPHDPSDFYNLSKLMGEALCLSIDSPVVRIARLSNVYGDDWQSKNFLTSIIRAAVDEGHVQLHESPDSVKDYVGIAEVITLLEQIALRGQKRIYNLASGRNVSHHQIAQKLCEITGCTIGVDRGAVAAEFPIMDIARIHGEFPRQPACVIDYIEEMVASYRRYRGGT